MSSQPLSPPSYVPGYAPAIEVPSYLRLHWALLLLMNSVTNGLLVWVWLIMQASWARKITGQDKAFKWTIASLIISVGVGVLAGIGFVGAAMMNGDSQTTAMVIVCVLAFAGVITGMVIYILAVFELRRQLEAAPFGIVLSGPMTFFFGAIYFQYHLQNWGLPGFPGGSPLVYAAPPPPPPPAPPPPPPVSYVRPHS